MVHKGSNKVGWFLEAAVFVKGGRKRIIWLPEGHGGWGWRCFVGELQHLLGLIIAKDRPVVAGVIASGGGISSS